ncbi:MAG: SMC-Scp complex subunit ScpB [Chloroflexi bacterium]|nr:SMC-Scp complex subunit ScpB [Chloroflexota bacterium]
MPENSLPLAIRIESLLFVAGDPIPLETLAQVLEVPLEEAQAAVTSLQDDLKNRGVRLQHKGGRIQLVSAPESAALVERFLGLEVNTRLSPAALEALAVIAYRQPVTRAQIEAIRGVNCDGVLRSLLSRQLIEEVGRLESAGRPILFGTTFTFLQYFGLRDVSELPPLEGDLIQLLPPS